MTILLAVSIVAYPFLGSLVALTSLPSLIASAPVRALILILSMLLVMRMSPAVLLRPEVVALLFFWLIYLVRIVYDLYVAEVSVAGDFLFTFLVFCIPPALAALAVEKLDELKLAGYLLLGGLATSVVVLLVAYAGLSSGRLSGDVLSGRFATETVNPITYGHIGVTTIIAGFWLSWRAKTLLVKFGCLAAIVAGASVVQFAASRGPLLALVGCMLFLVLSHRRFAWLVIPVIAAAAGIAILTVSEVDSVLATRLAASVDQEESPEIRVLMLAGAIQQFLDSPLAGSSIIEFGYQDYPHNYVIEAAMATGVMGLGLILLVTANALRGAVQSIRKGEVLVPMLLIQALLAALVSGSLAASSTLWTLLAFFTVRRAFTVTTSNGSAAPRRYREYVSTRRA